LELARAMIIDRGLPIIDKGLPIFLWDEAVAHANYLQNKAPTGSLKDKTPDKAWKGKKPNIAHLRMEK
jgi:hypothetical protein